MRAPEWRSLVRMPDCEPVNEIASSPSSSSAIDSSAIDSRSPHDSSMSSSRRGGDGVTVRAIAISWLVVLPIADTTTTTRLPGATVAATRSATRPSRAGSATDEPPYFCTTIGFTSAFIHFTSLDSVSYPRYSRRMSLRRLVACWPCSCLRARSARRVFLNGAAASRRPARSKPSPARMTTTRASRIRRAHRARARARRAPRRAGGLARRPAARGADRGHAEEAYEQLKQAATLWDAEELAGKSRGSAAARRRRAHRAASSKRGAHEEVLFALAIELALEPATRRPRALRRDPAGCAPAAPPRAKSAPRRRPRPGHRGSRDGGRAVAVAVRRRRADAPLLRAPRRRHHQRSARRSTAGVRAAPPTCARCLQGGPRPSTGYDLARLYLRISSPTRRWQAARHQDAAAGRRADAPPRRALRRQAGDAARRHRRRRPAGPGPDDADVAQRVCIDATVRFPQAPEPHLCAGRGGDGARSARRRHARLRGGAPAPAGQPRDLGAAWRSLWSAASRLVSDENLDLPQLEPQLKKRRSVPRRGAKAVPRRAAPPVAGRRALRGRPRLLQRRPPAKAMEYLERSVAIEPRRRRSSRWDRSA